MMGDIIDKLCAAWSMTPEDEYETIDMEYALFPSDIDPLPDNQDLLDLRNETCFI